MVLFCHITSRVEADKHQDLLREKGGRGFPYLVFLDAEGNVLTQQRARTVEGFEETLASLRRLDDLRGKADGGDKAAATELLIAETEMGRHSLEEARARFQKLGVTDKAATARFESVLLDREVEGVAANVRSKDSAIAAGKQFLAMEGEGRIPTGDNAVRTFWQMILTCAEAEKDAGLYEKCLGKLRPIYEKLPNGQKALDRMEATLKELRSGS